MSKRSATDTAHVTAYTKARTADIGGRDRVSGIGNQKVRTVAGATAKGGSHTITEMVTVGKGPQQQGCFSNEQNTQHYKFYSKVQVTASKNNQAACFEHLASQVAKNLPGFNPAEYGLVGCKKKNRWVAAIKVHLGQ